MDVRGDTTLRPVEKQTAFGLYINPGSMVDQELRQALAGQDVALSVSVGVSVSHPQDANLDELLERADLALYVAKQTGRARIVSVERVPSEAQAQPRPLGQPSASPRPALGRGAPLTRTVWEDPQATHASSVLGCVG